MSKPPTHYLALIHDGALLPSAEQGMPPHVWREARHLIESIWVRRGFSCVLGWRAYGNGAAWALCWINPEVLADQVLDGVSMLGQSILVEFCAEMDESLDHHGKGGRAGR